MDSYKLIPSLKLFILFLLSISIFELSFEFTVFESISGKHSSIYSSKSNNN